MFPHERSLVKRMANRPFALLGVSCDEDHDALRRMIESEHLTWPSWMETSENPVCSKWHVEFLPSIYVLDFNGVIRLTPDDYSGDDGLDALIDRLVADAEQARKSS